MYVGAAVGYDRHDEDPADEYCPVEQLVHLVAPMKIVCVALKRALTSIADNTLAYIRKSLMNPFKYSLGQLSCPKKLLDLETDVGYGFDGADVTCTPFMYATQGPEGASVHATWFQEFWWQLTDVPMI